MSRAGFCLLAQEKQTLPPPPTGVGSTSPAAGLAATGPCPGGGETHVHSLGFLGSTSRVPCLWTSFYALHTCDQGSRPMGSVDGPESMGPEPICPHVDPISISMDPMSVSHTHIMDPVSVVSMLVNSMTVGSVSEGPMSIPGPQGQLLKVCF